MVALLGAHLTPSLSSFRVLQSRLNGWTLQTLEQQPWHPHSSALLPAGPVPYLWRQCPRGQHLPQGASESEHGASWSSLERPLSGAGTRLGPRWAGRCSRARLCPSPLAAEGQPFRSVLSASTLLLGFCSAKFGS